jgi:hypothetical protein
MKNWIFISIIALLVVSCDKQRPECPGSNERAFAITGFTRINAGDAHHVTITKSDQFSIKASGCTEDLDDLELTLESNHILNIKYKNSKNIRYRVDFTITMPTLVSVNLSGASQGFINGFGGQNTVIRTVVSGASECSVSGTGINASFGHFRRITGFIFQAIPKAFTELFREASELRSYDVSATDVDISVSGSSTAYVRPLESIFAEASGSSVVYYKGTPATTHFETSGNSKIIRE